MEQWPLTAEKLIIGVVAFAAPPALALGLFQVLHGGPLCGLHVGKGHGHQGFLLKLMVYQHIDVVTVKRKPKHFFYLTPLGEKGQRVDGEGFSSEADEEGMFSFVEIVLLAKL